MARIVMVHGICNEYLGEMAMHKDWFPALSDGLTRARVAPVDPGQVSCAFYGDLFRGGERTLSDDIPYLSVEDIEPGLEEDLLLAWWAEAARVDPWVVPPGERTLSGIRRLQDAVNALLGSRCLAGLTERVLIFWLSQVRRYFTEPALRLAARNRLAEQIQGDTQVIVAHSLGSVVAYEALCAHPQWPVRTLVTLGSPLAVRGLVFDRLDPRPAVDCNHGPCGKWPGSLRTWTNVSDEKDIIALVKDLQPWFGSDSGTLRNIVIDNGVSAHKVQRYLTSRSVGRAVADGLVVDG